jgi:pimeloyl-ACP methyl ester carboxylesterase
MTTMNASTPTIVFVHGAWADASGWGASISALRDRGFAAIGFANPLRHLTDDAAYLATLLGTISGPIVLVGHSYGGAVMSNAATGNEQVQALVFVNGWMPDEGESIQQLLESEAFADSLVPGLPGCPLRDRDLLLFPADSPRLTCGPIRRAWARPYGTDNGHASSQALRTDA